MGEKEAEKALTRMQKKRDKAKQRDKLKRIAQQLNHCKGYEIPSGVRLYELADEYCDKLRWNDTGYSGTKGLQQGLHNGTDMASALTDTRNEWFEGQGWQNVLADIKKCATDWDMEDRENDFARKAGPFFLRPFRVWSKKAFELFTEPRDAVLPREELVKSILTQICNEYLATTGGRVSALHPKDTQGKINQKASSGWPFFSKKWQKPTYMQGEEISPFDWALREASNAVDTGDYSLLHESVYIMFTRKQYRGVIDSPDLKMNERPVQCSAGIERMIGSGVQQVLLKVQRAHEYSQGHCGVWSMGAPIKTAMEQYDHTFEADYSGFDATIRSDVMRWIFDLVLIPLFSEQDTARLEAMRDHYSKAELWTPLGIVTSDNVGLMSGSILTNCIGMIYGHMAWYYFNQRLAEEGVNLRAKAFGYSDDLAAFFDKPEQWDSPKDIITHFSRITDELGLVAHPEKQGVFSGENREISFLGCVFFKHRHKDGACLPVYPIMRGASKLIWQEHWSHGEKGELVIRYRADGLSYWEKTIAAMIGRLDVMQHNEGFPMLVRYVYLQTGITPFVCQRFLPDHTVSPTLRVITSLIGLGMIPVQKSKVVLKVEKAMTDDGREQGENLDHQVDDVDDEDC